MASKPQKALIQNANQIITKLQDVPLKIEQQHAAVSLLLP
jgi:hypothetical protein